LRERLVKNKSTYPQEAIFPSESRWDRAPQFTSNWKTLADYAEHGPELTPTDQLKMLKRGITKDPGTVKVQDPTLASLLAHSEALQKKWNKPAGSTKAAAAGSPSSPAPDKFDLDAMDLSVPLEDLISIEDIAALAKKPKMTKAERIAKWGNPGIKASHGSVYFSNPEDFLNYRLPNSSFVGMKDPTLGGWMADPDSPLAQAYSGAVKTTTGGPKITPGTSSKVALELAKKGAKPYSLSYFAEEGAPEDIVEELKKYFSVWTK
jgi:hypothetical protein